MPHDPEEKRTGRARRRFYGAYGRLWLAVPVAFIISGMSSSYADAYILNPSKTTEQYERAQRYQYISLGTIIAAGLVGAEAVYRIFRYVRTSGEDAVSERK
jgi:hypothetical protein